MRRILAGGLAYIVIYVLVLLIAAGFGVRPTFAEAMWVVGAVIAGTSALRAIDP